MGEIKIFLCCHNRYEVVPPLCEPLQCGAAIHPAIGGILHDNDGQSISEKNHEYCELTAHYYAWKNVCAEYYGFCHYRRFFSAKNHHRPYLVRSKLSKSDTRKLFRDEQFWCNIIKSHNIIVPRSEDMGITAREHYNSSQFHYAEDLRLFSEILSAKVPQLRIAAEKYLSQNRQYFCNMFIMDKKFFFQYCEWLFDILEEFDKRKTLHGDFQSDRTDGYLGEIFTGIYLNYCVNNGAKILELPRIDVDCSIRKRLSCMILPSESKRRFMMKKLVKKIKGK